MASDHSIDSDSEEETPWCQFFSEEINPYYGWVKDIGSANTLVDEFALYTSTSYAVPRCTKNFGAESLSGDHCVRWEDDGLVKHGTQIPFQNVPFFIIGHRLMECHQGPNYRKKEKKDEGDNDHQYPQETAKKRNTGSKKLGCSAAVYMREIMFFPEYKIIHDTPHFRRVASERLKADMTSPAYQDIVKETRIYVDLPKINEHSKHIMGDAADLKAPIDQRVVDHIYFLVDEGVYNIGEMKRHVLLFVKALFGKTSLPSPINRRFYPSRKDLRSMIDRRRRKLVQGFLDQELLMAKVKEWKEKDSNVFIHVRLSASVKRPVVEDDQEEGLIKIEDQPFLFVYQNAWQKYMLQRYGGEMVFLDATYRTTKYALPLFFVCVHANSGYYVVGAFITQKEDSDSISEALDIIKGLNPSWKPKSFMIDASEIEMMSIIKTFPGSSIFICDFHRKQAWRRWTSASINGVMQQQDEILSLLNGIAESLTEEEFKHQISKLRNSPLWESKLNLQKYIEKEWLSKDKHKMWVWAYRGDMLTFVVNTNNGVEAQNKVFKYDYLAPYRVKTISGLMSVLIDDFFLDAHREYLESNVTMCIGWRSGGEFVPEELHHRPKYFIKHMRDISVKAAQIQDKKICQVDTNKYSVESETSSVSYEVFLGDDDSFAMPSCSCVQFQRTHLPCKHFGAVFMKYQVNLLNLPKFYTSHQMLVVDLECLKMTESDLTPMNHFMPSLTKEDVSEVDEPQYEDKLEESVPTTLDLDRSGKRVREVLLKIRSLTYIATDVEMLEQVRLDLSNIEQYMLSGCPQDGGITLESSTPKLKSGGKRKPSINLNKLPPRKKRKPNKGITSLKETTVHVTPNVETQPMTLNKNVPTGKTMPRKPRYSERCKPTEQHDILPECKDQLAQIKQHQAAVNKTDVRPILKGHTVAFNELPFIKMDLLKPRVNVGHRKSMRVGSNSFTGQDLSTLNGSNWLNDKVMQAYLGLLMFEKNRMEPGCLLVLPSFLAVKWEQQKYHEWLFMETQFSKYHWIVIPVCTKNHWIILVANMVDHRFAVLNSMKRAYPVQGEMFTHWLMYMTCRQRKTKEPFVKWTCIAYEEEQQRDGHSCGPFALMFAEALISGADIRCIKQEQMKDARLYIKNRLLHSAKINDRSLCDLPFCEGADHLKNSTMIECKRCCGLVHAECAQVEHKKDYACLTCEQADFNASYKLQCSNDHDKK